MKQDINILDLVHRMIEDQVEKGDFCIDATAGRGNDTAFLCKCVGDKGKVLAFDIQEEAILSTQEYLHKNKLNHIARLIQANHKDMNQYAEDESVDCIVFNLGYLPGGNHQIKTQAATSIEAIEIGLRLLKRKGMMSLCLYYGKDIGTSEKEAVLSYLKTLDTKLYTVIVSEFYNRPNDPPIPVCIYKR